MALLHSSTLLFLLFLSIPPAFNAKNVTEILNGLTSDYDKRLRPNYGGPPVVIEVTMHVSDISAISEVAMDYTVDLYLRQFWRDPRLQFTGTNESLTIGIDMVQAIWVPDTFFPNEKKSFFHEATTHNSFLRINHHGNVTRSMRLTVTANCPMNLEFFPLDKQNCSLEIESYGYSSRDISYTWKEGRRSVSSESGINLAQFRIGLIHISQRMINLSTGNYSRLSAFFHFERAIGFYLIQIYLPSSLIVVISWVSFWLNREATQARVAIGVTTVLTMTTLMTSTNSSMPKVSYVKSIDIYLGTCFIIVFASLLEYAAVGYLMKRMRMNPKEGTRPPSYSQAQFPESGIAIDRRLEVLSEEHSWMNDETNQYYQLMDEQQRRRSSFMDTDSRFRRPFSSHNESTSRSGYAPIGSPAHESGRSWHRGGSRRSGRVGDPRSPGDCDPLLLDASSHSPNHSTHRLSYASTNNNPTAPFPSQSGWGERGAGGSFRFPVGVNWGVWGEAVTSPDKGPCDCDLDFVSPPPSRLNSRRSLIPLRPVRLRPRKVPNTIANSSFKPSNIDKYSRIFFPLIFVSFHVVYWTIYLNAEAIFGRS